MCSCQTLLYLCDDQYILYATASTQAPLALSHASFPCTSTESIRLSSSDHTPFSYAHTSPHYIQMQKQFMSTTPTQPSCLSLISASARPPVGLLPAMNHIQTPARLEVWKWELASHPDQKFAGFTLEGQREGFHVGFQQAYRMVQVHPQDCQLLGMRWAKHL